MRSLADAVAHQWGQPLVATGRALWELGLVDFRTYARLQASPASAVRTWMQAHHEHGQIGDAEFEHLKAVIARVPEVDAGAFQPTPEALERLPLTVAAPHQALPLGVLDDNLWVASARPMDRELQSELSVLAGMPVMLAWAPLPQITARLAGQPPAPPSEGSRSTGRAPYSDIDLPTLLARAQEEISERGVQEQVYAVDIQSNVVQLVKRIIEDAHDRKASDIHIESNFGDQLSRVRFRIDGDLEEYVRLPASVRAALISRIKVMAKLDIAERRRPQDGKINFSEYGQIRLELRVACVPTHDGLEDAVLRLLATSEAIPLARLGLSARDARSLQRAAHRPYGLILACGPTGSGKTTTLHSIISHLNTDDRKIWTAEDPIEITQPGLRQLQVNPKIGVTFASAMRAFLRADPDIIMVGEVRDAETAHVCIEASLTGHLVMSTLHTNSAAESVVRLLDLGIDPMNFGDSLVAVVAQRLVRALCMHCREPRDLSGDDMLALAATYVAGTPLPLESGRERLLEAVALSGHDRPALWHGRGCPHCNGKGTKGRLGVYEIIENDADIKPLIHARAATDRIFEHALSKGARSLRQDALEKVMAGQADHSQVAFVSQ
ncbi:GspE/PulE family protein [Ramlibacter sp.]|uniref:GspE/PulE family protein n=1 Tax=Ramlibacter sp. TaxID=1917967 RepID=UPI0035B178A8